MKSLTLNHVLHSIAEDGDYDWGVAETTYLEDVCDILNGTFQEVTASGAATTIDFDNGKNVKLNLNASTTLTLSNPRGGRPAYIYIKQAGSFTITWPSTIKWRGAVAPTLTTGAGKRDVVALMWELGDGVYLGEYALNFG
jgi:hypothetical protein